MGTSVSIYSTITQADQLLVEVPENSLLQTRYFPTRPGDEFKTKEVLFDFDESDLKAGAFVKQGYVDGNTTVWRGNSVEPPRVGISDTIDPTNLDRVLFERLVYAQGAEDPNRDEAFDDLKRVKAGRLVKRIQRSIEQTCASVLLNNGVSGTMPASPTDATPVPIDIEYFDPTKGNVQRYIPSYPWGNASATPYSDIVAMVNALVEHGGKAEDLLIAPQAWAILEQDELFNKQFTQIHTEDSVLFGRSIEDARHVGIANFGGYLLNCVVYYGQYKNDAGQMVQYLPKDFVCILAPDCGRTLCGGTTLLNPETIAARDVVSAKSFESKSGKYIVSQYMDLNDQKYALRCESRPLPAPYSPWRWITMEARNSNDISGGTVGADVSLKFVFVDTDGNTITPTTKPSDISHFVGGAKLLSAQVPDLVLSGYTFVGYKLEDGTTWSKGLDSRYTCPVISQTITGVMSEDE